MKRRLQPQHSRILAPAQTMEQDLSDLVEVQEELFRGESTIPDFSRIPPTRCQSQRYSPQQFAYRPNMVR